MSKAQARDSRNTRIVQKRNCTDRRGASSTRPAASSELHTRAAKHTNTNNTVTLDKHTSNTIRTYLAANIKPKPQTQTNYQLNRTYNFNLAAGSSLTIFLILTPPLFVDHTDYGCYLHGGRLCGMPACGQAVGCGVCDTPELWRGAAGLCARIRACAGAAEYLHKHLHRRKIPTSGEPINQSVKALHKATRGR